MKQYWAIENCLSFGEEHIQRIIPSGLTELTFFLCTKPKSLDNHKSITENTILSGHLKNYYDIAITGNLSMFSVSFLPFGVRMFLKMPADEIYDLNVPLRFILPEKSHQLEDTLFEADSFTERVSIIEKFLNCLLTIDTNPYDLKRIDSSMQLIKGAKGSIQVDTLSDAMCLSRKQFERIFSSNVGISPKQFLKTIRFQGSLHLKHVNPSMSLTELAYNCGYFDQAHMINDYKTLSGKTPGQYFAECEPFSDYFDY